MTRPRSTVLICLKFPTLVTDSEAKVSRKQRPPPLDPLICACEFGIRSGHLGHGDAPESHLAPVAQLDRATDF
jgi:hypothetical protein